MKQTTTLKTRVEVFQVDHLIDLELRYEEKVHLFSAPGMYERTYLAIEDSLAAGTMLAGDKVIACFGVTQLFPGVYDLWILPSRFIPDVPIFFGKTIKQYLNSFLKTFPCHRIQTTSFDDEFHERWMKWLGFEKEGTLRKFTHTKQNYCIYSRVF